MNKKVKDFLLNHRDIINGLPVTWDEVYDCAKKELNTNEILYFALRLWAVDIYFEWKNLKNIDIDLGDDLEDFEIFGCCFRNKTLVFKKLIKGEDGKYCYETVKNFGLEKVRDFLLDNDVRVVVNNDDKEIFLIKLRKRNMETIWENNKQKKLFKEFSDKTLKKAKSGNFCDLIPFIEYHTIDKIVTKPKEEMENFRRTKEDSSVISILGCYCNNQVWLCDELIKKTANELTEEFAGYLYGKERTNLRKEKAKMKALLYKKVFTHEFGHRAFDWVCSTNREIKEKQANYFSSYITNGEIDDFILEMTRRQPEYYQNPYLKGDSRATSLYEDKL